MQTLSRPYAAYTLVELLCVLGIVAALAAVTLPTVATVRRRGQASTCLSHQHQWGVSLQSYIQDYDGIYPAALTATFSKSYAHGGTGWYSALRPYMGVPIFICPSRWVSQHWSDRVYSCGYALNAELNDARRSRSNTLKYEGKNEASLQLPANIVAVFDVRPGIIASDIPDVPNPTEIIGIYDPAMTKEILSQTPGAIRHSGGANYVFTDGHTKWLHPDALERKCTGTKACFTE